MNILVKGFGFLERVPWSLKRWVLYLRHRCPQCGSGDVTSIGKGYDLQCGDCPWYDGLGPMYNWVDKSWEEMT